MPQTPEHILDSLTSAILEKQDKESLRVAINGKDASGKTILADNLSTHLEPISTQPVHRISFDEYLNPPEIRNQPFEDEARGSYDQAFNYRNFAHNIAEYARIKEGIFIVDGLFLFRSFLADNWHLKVLLEANEDVLIERGSRRDTETYGGYDKAKTRFLTRFMPSQDIYFSEEQPDQRADIIIDNTIPEAAVITKL